MTVLNYVKKCQISFEIKIPYTYLTVYSISEITFVVLLEIVFYGANIYCIIFAVDGKTGDRKPMTYHRETLS